MVSVKKSKTLFLGLTHIGQIYSTSWIRKVGPCAVHDFNNASLNSFKKSIFTKVFTVSLDRGGIFWGKIFYSHVTF